jgi:hypothetical protein
VGMARALGQDGAIEALGLEEPVGALQLDRLLKQCVYRKWRRRDRSFREQLGHKR